MGAEVYGFDNVFDQYFIIKKGMDMIICIYIAIHW